MKQSKNILKNSNARKRETRLK